MWVQSLSPLLPSISSLRIIFLTASAPVWDWEGGRRDRSGNHSSYLAPHRPTDRAPFRHDHGILPGPPLLSPPIPLFLIIITIIAAAPWWDPPPPPSSISPMPMRSAKERAPPLIDIMMPRPLLRWINGAGQQRTNCCRYT